MENKDVSAFIANAIRIQPFNSAILANDNTVQTYACDWLPKYWLVVGRLTSGYAMVHAGGSPSSYAFRIQSTTLKLPYQNDKLTVQHVGATGFYDVYAVYDNYNFEVSS